MNAATVYLNDGQLEQIAERVANRLTGTVPAEGLVDAETVARALGVTRKFVYEHGAQLGAVRLGDKPGARIRFDLNRARAAFESGT